MIMNSAESTCNENTCNVKFQIMASVILKSDNLTRLMYCLSRSCTKVIKALVLYYLPLARPSTFKELDWNLDEFLNIHRDGFVLQKFIKDENIKKVLFPGLNKRTDINHWDLGTLFTVLGRFQNVDGNLKIGMNTMRQLRNKLFHWGSKDMEDALYERNRRIIDKFVHNCCRVIDNDSIKRVVKVVLEKEDETKLNEKDLLKELEIWIKQDILDILDSTTKPGILDTLEEVGMKLSDILEMQRQKMAEIKLTLTINNCNKETSDKVTDILDKYLQNNPSDVVPIDRTINDAIQEAKKKLLCQDRKLRETCKACVILTVQCPDFNSLKSLLEECMTGKLTADWKSVESILRHRYENDDLSLEFTITNSDFWCCIGELVETLTTAVYEQLGVDISPHISPEIMIHPPTSLRDDNVSGTVTAVPLTIKPKSYRHALEVSNIIQSSSLNEDFRKISTLLADVYGMNDVTITANLETTETTDHMDDKMAHPIPTPDHRREMRNENDSSDDSSNESEMPCDPVTSGHRSNIFSAFSVQNRYKSNDKSLECPVASEFLSSDQLTLFQKLVNTNPTSNVNTIKNQGKAETTSLFDVYVKQFNDTSLNVTIIKDTILGEDELPGNRTHPYCDNCLERDLSARIVNPKGSIASSVCFDCNQYLCAFCQSDHTGHVFCKMNDQFNNDTCIKLMRDQLLKETYNDRLEELYSERSSVFDNIVMDHPEDESEMNMTETISFLRQKRMWVVSDLRNPCIKMVNMSNSHIVRYINFSSVPLGMTEIPDDICPLTSLGSANTDTGQKQHLIVMWFLVKSFISIVDINLIPARIVKCIQLQGNCFDVFYSQNKLIVHCARHKEDRTTIDIMTIDGQTINVIDLSQPEINLNGTTPIQVAMHEESETIYVCINSERKIYSLDIEGNIQNRHVFRRFTPLLICLDQHQRVFVCTEEKPYQIYKMSSDLKRCTLFIHDSLRNMATENIISFSCCNDKFYIGHKLDSGQTVVTIIKSE